MMRILITVFCGLWFSSLTVFAQTTVQSDATKQFYVLVGPTSVKQELGRVNSVALGVGVEHWIGQHAFFGGEIAETVLSSSLRDPGTNRLKKHAGHVLWVALNGGYQFRSYDDPRSFKPFVTAGCGISGVQDAGVGSQLNYGVGFNRWQTNHLGVRLEIRRFFHAGDAERRFTALRLGLALR